jgi:transcriptional regulator with PAS, ATPase and Fis domain
LFAAHLHICFKRGAELAHLNAMLSGSTTRHSSLGPLAPPNVVGSSPALQRVLHIAARLASGDSKVLITGESGVGKDVVARYVHVNSSRAEQRFVALNCASVTETLLESELFGHVKGSFTGAYRDKVGKLQQAHKGTIFLDEIGEMSLRMQAMLLRFLENGEVVPVGADTPPARVDVRVISATNRNLQDMVTKGTFREDLLYRINVGQIEVPPLRDRREDVRALVQYVIAKHNRSVTVDPQAMEALERYRWPGNVRELQNVVEQMLALVDGDRMGTELLPPNVTARAGKSPHPVRERRRRVADELYDGLTEGGCNFWNDVYPMFMSRDLTRDDLRALIRKGLAATKGSYRGLLQLFGLEDGDYKRLLNFLASHECAIDFREFRTIKHERGASGAA